MCIELMLNAVNLTLVTSPAERRPHRPGHRVLHDGLAAAEVVVGLAIIVSVFRTRRSASVDDANLLKY